MTMKQLQNPPKIEIIVIMLVRKIAVTALQAKNNDEMM